MIKRIPQPTSGGLILSYKCTAECRHCMYGCSYTWSSDWISHDDMDDILKQLSGKILPSPFGPKTTGLNYGLHITGGEPFLNFELLCEAVEAATKHRIPSLFVETSCFWATDDATTKDKLRLLKKKGLRGIMISVNPFYLEFVPFERTERAIKISLDLFGRNAMVYQLEYFRRFKGMGIQGKIAFEDYLKLENQEEFLRDVEFFNTGRAPFRLHPTLEKFLSMHPAEHFVHDDCITPFLRNWHNHFDNYGNYIPGFCGGISLGDARELDRILKEGIDVQRHPILGYLLGNDFAGLYQFAREHHYEQAVKGYFSKCHLCTDIRRFLALNGDFPELKPKEFYLHLE